MLGGATGRSGRLVGWWIAESSAWSGRTALSGRRTGGVGLGGVDLATGRGVGGELDAARRHGVGGGLMRGGGGPIVAVREGGTMGAETRGIVPRRRRLVVSTSLARKDEKHDGASGRTRNGVWQSKMPSHLLTFRVEVHVSESTDPSTRFPNRAHTRRDHVYKEVPGQGGRSVASIRSFVRRKTRPLKGLCVVA